MDYIIGGKIGKGVFSTVYKCKKEDNDYALKRFRSKNTNKEMVLRETRILIILQDHPNIVKYYQTFTAKNGKYFICMELCESSLCEYLAKRGKLNEGESRYYMYQLLDGLNWCHQNWILHRDIKPSNLLICNAALKICDFGLSIRAKNFQGKFITNVCAPWFRAPELYKGKTGYGPEIDIWSAGCVWYFMLNGKCPYRGNSENQLRVILTTHIEFTVQLMSKMLNINPEERLSADELMHDEYFHQTF